MKLKLLFLLAVLSINPLHAQTANSTAQSQSQVDARQGNAQAITFNSQTPDHGRETILANPGAALYGPGMSYSNFNCANGRAVSGSSFLVSLGWSGSHESSACNFRANAALHASIAATPHVTQDARDAAAMADYVTCTTSGKRVLRACQALGLVVNADTPSTTTSDTWHACHVNATMLGACKREGLVSQNDEPIETAVGH